MTKCFQLNRAASSMVCMNKDPEPESRRQPSIPQTTSPVVHRPRQKAQAHKPLRRSRSIPRETTESSRRKAREFGETVGPSGPADRGCNQFNRHSFNAFSTESSRESSESRKLQVHNVFNSGFKTFRIRFCGEKSRSCKQRNL